MTREEITICKMYLEDLDKHHDCNEYKLLMGLLEQEPILDKIRAEIMELYNDRPRSYNHHQRTEAFGEIIKIIDKYKESENKKCI